MDVADVAEVGRPRAPRAVGRGRPGGGLVRRRPAPRPRSQRRPRRAGTSSRPSHPPRWEDADPHTWDAKLRLERMDEYGVWAQVLYPNVALFNSALLQRGGRPRAWSSSTSGPTTTSRPSGAARRPTACIAVTTLPFWDLEATLAEIERVRGDGPSRDRVLAGPVGVRPPASHRSALGSDVGHGPGAAPAGELPHRVRRHVAAGRTSGHASVGQQRPVRVDGRLVLPRQRPDDRQPDLRRHLPPVPRPRLRVGGERRRVDPVRPRRPRLAVEELRRRPRSTRSTTCCRASTSPRQIYGCFWFEEEGALYALDRLGPDNILYETDFPHPTSMSPGPASAAGGAEHLPRGELRRPRRRRARARSCTTTRRASTSSTEPGTIPRRRSRPPGSARGPARPGRRDAR